MAVASAVCRPRPDEASIHARRAAPSRLSLTGTATASRIAALGGGPCSFPWVCSMGLELAGYLKAVWPKIFSQVFPGFLSEVDPRDAPRSPGPAPHINFHEKSAPQTNFKAKRSVSLEVSHFLFLRNFTLGSSIELPL